MLERAATTFEALVLGFDARIPAPDVTPFWTEQRRSIFLLREDVEQPLSTDRLVWPSALTAGETSHSGSWNGLELWEDLSRLRWCAGGRPHWTVAVTLMTGGLNAAEREIWSPRRPLADISIPNDAASFLGYDVSDTAFLSALSNCGYDHQEITAARRAWGARLNQSHLFDDLSDAAEFKTFADRRVPEHAPFFVYALHRITATEVV